MDPGKAFLKTLEAKEYEVNMYVDKGVQIEDEATDKYTPLSKISDHYPVVADIELKRKKDIKDYLQYHRFLS